MFDRHVELGSFSVLLGASSEATQRLQSLAKLSERARRMLEARVLETRGTNATLEVEGHRIQAKTHVPLNAGDRLWLRVEQQSDGTIRLAIQASGPDVGASQRLAQSALDDQLREQGLPVDDKMRLIARALIARDGLLRRQDAVRLSAALGGFSKVSAQEVGAAVMLQRVGVPLTAASIVQVALRSDATAPLRVGAVLDALLPEVQAMAVRSRGATATLAQQVLTALEDFSRLDEHSAAERALKTWVDGLTPPGAPARGSQLARAVSSDERSPPGVASGDSLASKQDGEALPGVLASQPYAPSGRINYVNPLVRQGPDLAGLLSGLVRLIGSEQSALKQQLNEAVAEIRTLQLSHSSSPSPATPEEGVHVPLFLSGAGVTQHVSGFQVHPSLGEAQESETSPSRRYTLLLETEFLGVFQADIRVAEGVISLSLGLSEPAVRDFVEQHADELRDALQRKGVRIGQVATRTVRAVPRDPAVNPARGDAVQFDRRI